MGPGGSRDYRSAAFDYRTDFAIVQPLQRAPADAVLVVDGIFLQRPELARVWDLVIFVDVTFEAAAARALERAFSEEGRDAGLAEINRRRYVPAQQIYFDAYRPIQTADIVIDNNDIRNPKVFFKGRGPEN